LYHDGKNRAVLRSLRLAPGFCLEADFLLQPSFAQQRLLILPPGRYAQGDNTGDNLKLNKID
jgi:hypothetical protein